MQIGEALEELASHIGGAQVKLPPGPVAKFHQVPIGEPRPADHAMVEPLRRDPLAKVLGDQIIFGLGPPIGLGAGIDHEGEELGGVRVQFLGQGQGLVHGVPGFSRQTHQKAAMDQDARLAGVPEKLPNPLHPEILPHPVQDGLIAAFNAHAKQAGPGPFQELHGFQVDFGPRVGRPGEFQVPPQDLLGKGDAPLLVESQGVVFEHDFPHVGKFLQDVRNLIHHVADAPVTEPVTAEGLGIDAVDAAMGTTPAGNGDDNGIAAVGIEIVPVVEVPLVHRADERQGVQVGGQLPGRGSHRPAVAAQTQARHLPGEVWFCRAVARSSTVYSYSRMATPSTDRLHCRVSSGKAETWGPTSRTKVEGWRDLIRSPASRSLAILGVLVSRTTRAGC